MKSQLAALTKAGRRRYMQSRGAHRIVAPKNFSLINNPEEYIGFLIDFEESCYIYPVIIIDVRAIENLTIDAITTLLVKVADLLHTGVHIFGNFPKNSSLRQIWIQSGFNKYVDCDIKYKHSNHANGNIRKARSNQYLGEVAYKEIIQFAISKLYGERVCKGLYTVYGELMNNTVEHASGGNTTQNNSVDKESKEWWSSVYCDTINRRAHFTFVDAGVGIFRTAKMRNLAHNVKNRQFLFNKDRTEILQLMLEDKIEIPRTGEKKRGNGFPTIYRRLQMKQLENLIIISNNVYANVSTSDYRILENEFNGTFFYWEYSDDCK